MLSNFGIIFSSITLVTSFILIYFSFLELKISEIKIPKKIYNFSLVQLIFSLLSFLILLIGYVFSDFSMINVYENSHTTKPLFYKISGTWGNHEGSLLLWTNILVIFSFLFLILTKNKNKNFKILTLIFQNFLIATFFIFLLTIQIHFLQSFQFRVREWV